LNTATQPARKKSKWTKAVGMMVGVISVVSGALAIKDYFDHRPRYDLSGRWTIENTVERSSFSPYLHMRTTFTIAFTQNGTEFSGVGEKTTISGHGVSGHDHTPLKISGTINGAKIHATFTEQGVKRETSGAFDWEVADNGTKWIGTFYSTAAETSGPSILRR
jgi:hypothetical protein